MAVSSSTSAVISFSILAVTINSSELSCAIKELAWVTTAPSAFANAVSIEPRSA